MNENELNELDELRASYRAATRDNEPSEFLDARIRKLARDEVQGGNGKSIGAWSGMIGLAAAIGFAIVLVPAVLVQEPTQPAAQDAAQFAVRLHEEPAAETARSESLEKEKAAARAATETTERRRAAATDDQASRQMMAAAPKPTSPESSGDELLIAEEILAPAPASLKAEVLETLNAASANGELDMAALRDELAQASEPEWRVALVALRDSKQRPQAEELLPEYRKKFDLPETLTLDQLVVDASGNE